MLPEDTRKFDEVDAEILAKRMHDQFEKQAARFGIREYTAKPVEWSDVPARNKEFLTSVCLTLLNNHRYFDIEELGRKTTDDISMPTPRFMVIMGVVMVISLILSLIGLNSLF